MEQGLSWLAANLNVSYAITLIVSITVVMSVCLIWTSSRIWISLRRALHDTLTALKDAKTVNLSTLDQLTEQYSKSELLRDPWEEFGETLIRDDSEEEIQIFNTRPFSDFFSREILEHSLHLTLFRKIPTIITSVGLFFTFLFIVFGLMHLHIQDTGKVDGIKELVEGLSAKFTSSVVAIFCSILFIVLEHFLVRLVENKYQNLINTLDKKFSRKTSEDYLRSLDKNMRELSKSMRHFGTDMAGIIKEGLSEGMRPSTDRLLVAIENLEKQKSENIADTLSKLLNEFKGSLTQNTGNEFASLASSITNLSKTMNESAERTQATSTKIESLLITLDRQTQKQEKISDESVTKMQDGITKLLSLIENTSKIQSENLTKVLNEITSKTSQATMGLIDNVDSLSRRNAGVVDGFNSLNSNLSESIEKYKEAVGSTQTLITTTGSLATNVSNTVNQLAEIQLKMENTFHSFLSETDTVQRVQTENAKSVEHFREVFREVETGLEVILRQLADNMQKYRDLTKDGLESYLKEYDSSLSVATTKLSSTVRDLDEVLENLSDNLQGIRTIASKVGA